VVMRIGRCGKRFVQPSSQIAAREQIHAQQRDQIGRAPAEAGRQLQVTQREEIGQEYEDFTSISRSASMVRHQVQLHRTTGATGLRPLVHQQAQIDHGRVDAHEFVLEAELALTLRLGGDLVEQFDTRCASISPNEHTRVGRTTSPRTDSSSGALAAKFRPRLPHDAFEIHARISLSIWLKMLHDAFSVGLLRSGVSELGRSPALYTFR
jgi:hypothetical protein